MFFCYRIWILISACAEKDVHVRRRMIYEGLLSHPVDPFTRIVGNQGNNPLEANRKIVG